VGIIVAAKAVGRTITDRPSNGERLLGLGGVLRSLARSIVFLHGESLALACILTFAGICIGLARTVAFAGRGIRAFHLCLIARRRIFRTGGGDREKAGNGSGEGETLDGGSFHG